MPDFLTAAAAVPPVHKSSLPLPPRTAYRNPSPTGGSYATVYLLRHSRTSPGPASGPASAPPTAGAGPAPAIAGPGAGSEDVGDRPLPPRRLVKMMRKRMMSLDGHKIIGEGGKCVGN